MAFSEDEIATIRRFLTWLVDGEWLSGRYNSGEGVTGADDDGITVTEFSAVSDYDGHALETEESFIPWIALTDPDEYKRQQDAEKAEEARQNALRRQAEAQHQEALERAALAELKAKYEGATR